MSLGNSSFGFSGGGGGGVTPIIGGGTLNYLAKFTPDGTTIGNSLLFDNGTNVGVGTTDPLLRFVVNASDGQSLGVYNSSAEVISSQLYHENANGGSLRIYDENGNIKVLIAAKTNNSYINSGANFGIGTASPLSIFHVQHTLNDFQYEARFRNLSSGTSAASAIITSTDNSGFEFGQLSSTHTTYSGYGQLGDSFIRSAVGARNINIITDASNVGKILFWSRLNPTTDATTPSLAINGLSIGIATNVPSARFHIYTDNNDITGQSGQLINNVNAGISAAAALFFRNNDNKGFEIGVVSSTHTTYQDTYGAASDSFYTSVINGGNLIFKQRTVGKGIKFFNAGNGVITGQSSVNVSDNGTGFYTDTISAIVHVRGIDSTSTNYALKVDNSASSPLIYVKNNSDIGFGCDPTNAKFEFSGGNILLLTYGARFGSVAVGGYSSWGLAANEISTLENTTGNPLILQYTEAGRVAIGTNAPTAGTRLHVYRSVNDFLYEVKVENPNAGVTSAASILIQSDVGKMEFGQLSNAFTTYTGYGQTGDTFIKSGVGSRNMNFLTDPSNTGKFLFFSRLNPTTDAATPSLAIDGSRVGVGTNTINTSAVFEVSSTIGGVLFPRMTTTQKNNISSPAAGLVVYDTTLSKLCVYTSTWETITSS